MLRRGAAALAALVGLAAGCSGGNQSPGAHRQHSDTVAPTQETPGAGSRSGAAGGVLFGGNTDMALEMQKLGRRPAIVRVYYRMGEQFPRPLDRRWMQQGSTLLVSLGTLEGGPTWASIAAGRQDATVLAFLTAVDHAAVRYHLPSIYFCFQHEVDSPRHHRGLGTPRQFIQAWDHLHKLAATAHLNWNDGGRLHWVFILTHEAYVPLSIRPAWARVDGAPSEYFPGTNEVDILGTDGYVSYGCKAGQQAGGSPNDPATAESLFEPAVAFAHSYGGLPVFITEWGATYFPTSQRQVQFIHQMRSFLSANREVVAVLYWDTRGVGPHCNYSINRQPAAVAAMRELARSSLVQGHVTS